MKRSLTLMQDSLRGWTLARSDCQFQYLVYGGSVLLASMAIALSYIGVTGTLAFVPVVVALMAFGGYVGQGYEWRRRYDMSSGHVEQED